MGLNKEMIATKKLYFCHIILIKDDMKARGDVFYGTPEDPAGSYASCHL